MPSFKLTYFPARARAEGIRLLFAQAGVEYEDCRMEFQKFQEYKKDTPFGTLPVLEVDGKPLGESQTIQRYLSRLFGLAGNTVFDQALVESVVDALYEIQVKIFQLIFEKDAEEKKKKTKELEEGKAKSQLTTVNKMINDNKNSNMYIVGSSLTFADIYLYETVYKLVALCGEDLPKKYPQVDALYKHVADLPNIKTWVAKRPDTPF